TVPRTSIHWDGDIDVGTYHSHACGVGTVSTHGGLARLASILVEPFDIDTPPRGSARRGVLRLLSFANGESHARLDKAIFRLRRQRRSLCSRWRLRDRAHLHAAAGTRGPAMVLDHYGG